MSQVHNAERWYQMAGEPCANEVCSIVEWLDRQQEPARTRALASLSLYEGRRMSSLDPTAYFSAGQYALDGSYRRLYMNAARMIVHGAVAKIAGRIRPKCQMVASNAEWSTKRRAKRLERFVEAQMSQRQGRYRDAWAVGLRAFMDATIAVGRGTIKIYADPDDGKVVLERVLPWEVYTDARETRSGATPLSRFQRVAWDVDRLAARFPAHRDAIHVAERIREVAPTGGQRMAQSVYAYEAWRLPLGEGQPGRHVIAVKNQLLLAEDWQRDEFPFVDVYWSEEVLGDGGTSLVEEVEPICDEVNHTAERMREMERLAGNVWGSYEDGSVDPDELRSNENAVWIKHKPGTPPPTMHVPVSFGPTTLEWFQLNWQKCFEISGLSQATATSRRDPGVKSGVALRTVAALETERFSVQANAYEWMMAVDVPRHIIACTRELAAEEPDFAVKWPGKGYLEEIEWSDADLDEDMYEIQPYAVSGIVNTPEDRLEFGQELFNAGIIGKESFLRITETKDVEAEMRREDAQYSLIERYMQIWLDAGEEDEANGKIVYRPPIPFMNHAAAIIQCAAAYMQAELDGAPDFNLEFFRRFMSDCDREIKKIEAYQASLQAPKPAPGPPGAPAGAPPGAPPMAA